MVADPGRWPDVLVGVSDHLGAQGGMLIQCPPAASGRPATQTLARLSEEPAAIFQEHYVWNPWTFAIARVPFGKAASANSLIEPGTIEKTAFYADVLAPWDHADTLNITHKAFNADDSIGGFGFCLSSRAAERAVERALELDAIAPHLCRAFEASLLVGGQADGWRHLSTILELMPNCALLLDRRGYVTQANSAAAELLRQSDGIAFETKGGLRLVSALASERQAFSRMLDNALRLVSGIGARLPEPVRISRPSGAAHLLVTAVPLPRPAFAFADLVAPARVLVVIVDPAAKSRATASAIQAAYGLTGAEARVALLLASGITGAQMPAMLGVTAATIKTQLRRCFEKTGTHSQAELMRLFAMFPPSGRPEA
ncbi:helix-turn-helix transcriptional regulator [Bradyrhizobium sp. WSM 1704]|uniref:helix-turn-helix transcriptional regulator n=1 Tax=Bradyrhizobium semiaridum TaxID=2821404 RepID=UPI001CE3248E|nr:helix-turn-helix transcriptional regulator [Bradyrhizobium semiaridum]MCA6124986.1 helix-turn-helix transcriptional regulator [Bradyrhizobium semiaridum]